MNCPLCNEILIQLDEDPSIKCGNHYEKRFLLGEQYPRYVETATLDNFQIINLYNLKISGNFGLIKKYSTTMNLIGDSITSYNTILRVNYIIPIPTQENFVKRIKTILTFS